MATMSATTAINDIIDRLPFDDLFAADALVDHRQHELVVRRVGPDEPWQALALFAGAGMDPIPIAAEAQPQGVFLIRDPIGGDDAIEGVGCGELIAAAVIAGDPRSAVGRVVGIAVAPEHRRRGVGTYLLNEALWMLRADGWWCIDASAVPGSPFAELIAGVGFEPRAWRNTSSAVEVAVEHRVRLS